MTQPRPSPLILLVLAAARALCGLQLAVYVPLALVRDIRSLAPTNLAANALILYSVAVLAAFAIATVARQRRHLLREEDQAATALSSGADSPSGDYLPTAPSEAFGSTADSAAGYDDVGYDTGPSTALGWLPQPCASFATDDEFGGGGIASPTRLFNPRAFFLFVGTAAFVFEGVMALCLPLYSALPWPGDDSAHDGNHLRARFPHLFITVLGAIVAFYLSFGLLNWAAYGDATAMVLTANLPPGLARASVQAACDC
jgi:hypothetical protein